MSVDEAGEFRGIDRTVPSFGLLKVEEMEAVVVRPFLGQGSVGPLEHDELLRSVRPGSAEELAEFDRLGFQVWRMGLHPFIPGVHDFVARVSLKPVLMDVLPVEINVAGMQEVLFEMRMKVVVAQMRWNRIRVRFRLQPGGTIYEREIIDPINPFNPRHSYQRSDGSIIRAALNTSDPFTEALTTFAASMQVTAEDLRSADVQPEHVGIWLREPPESLGNSRFPIRDRPGNTVSREMGEQTVMIANETLEEYGVVVIDVKRERVTIDPALVQAQVNRAVAKRIREAAVDEAEALRLKLGATGLGSLPDNPGFLDRAAQAAVVMSMERSSRLRAGISTQDVPLVNVVIGGSGGGSGGGTNRPGPGGSGPRRR